MLQKIGKYAKICVFTIYLTDFLCYNISVYGLSAVYRGGGMQNMKIIKLFVGDVVELKKKHPCGSDRFKILRAGSDVRAICLGCSRDVTVDRVKFEHSIKRIVSSADAETI